MDTGRRLPPPPLPPPTVSAEAAHPGVRGTLQDQGPPNPCTHPPQRLPHMTQMDRLAQGLPHAQTPELERKSNGEATGLPSLWRTPPSPRSWEGGAARREGRRRRCEAPGCGEGQMPSGFWLGWDKGAPPARRPAPFSPTWLSGCPADPLGSGPLTLQLSGKHHRRGGAGEKSQSSQL